MCPPRRSITRCGWSPTAWAICWASLDQKTLDLQRGVVQNEKRQGENQPYGVTRAIDHAEYLSRRRTHIRGPSIGYMEDLNAASMSDVQEWFKTYYGPSNAVLVIAGDIDAKTAKDKVEKYFGDIPPGPPSGEAGSLDREDDRHASRDRAGSRSAGPHLQGLEHPPIRQRRCRLPGLGQRLPERGQDLAPLQTAGLRRSDRHRRESPSSICAKSAASSQIQATARPGQDLAQVEKELERRVGALPGRAGRLPRNCNA